MGTEFEKGDVVKLQKTIRLQIAARGLTLEIPTSSEQFSSPTDFVLYLKEGTTGIVLSILKSHWTKYIKYKILFNISENMSIEGYCTGEYLV
jgi:hypothetical protein